MFALSMAVELVLLLILCFGVRSGVNRGFVRMASKPVKLIASLIVAYSACGSIALRFTIPLIGAPISDALVGYLGVGLYNAVGERIVYTVSLILSFAVTYFLSRAAISALLAFSETVISNGALGCVNKAAGAMVGLLVAVICAWMFSAAVDIACSTGVLSEFTGVSESPRGMLYSMLRTGDAFYAWDKIQLINFR